MGNRPSSGRLTRVRFIIIWEPPKKASSKTAWSTVDRSTMQKQKQSRSAGQRIALKALGAVNGVKEARRRDRLRGSPESKDALHALQVLVKVRRPRVLQRLRDMLAEIRVQRPIRYGILPQRLGARSFRRRLVRIGNTTCITCTTGSSSRFVMTMTSLFRLPTRQTHKDGKDAYNY
eukprot:scaffold84133_cov61-Attheya_sp.AAC.6